jgi:hypothetical protein
MRGSGGVECRTLDVLMDTVYVVLLQSCEHRGVGAGTL